MNLNLYWPWPEWHRARVQIRFDRTYVKVNIHSFFNFIQPKIRRNINVSIETLQGCRTDICLESGLGQVTVHIKIIVLVDIFWVNRNDGHIFVGIFASRVFWLMQLVEAKDFGIDRGDISSHENQVLLQICKRCMQQRRLWWCWDSSCWSVFVLWLFKFVSEPDWWS